MSDAIPVTGEPKDREALKQRVLGTLQADGPARPGSVGRFPLRELRCSVSCTVQIS